MQATAVERVEALVLVDQQGTYYAIPRGVVERYRVTDEQKAEIEALRGEDVAGYLSFGSADLFIEEQTMGGMLAERRQEAGRERVVREARMAERTASSSRKQPQPGFINVVAAFTSWLVPHGLWRNFK